jgi:hypothetical protein
MMIPTRARASGIPTAHPIITPRFEPDFLLESGACVLAVPAALAEGFGDGVTVTVATKVCTPADPEETLVTSEVTGLADDAGEEVAAADEAGAEVFEGEFPPPPLAEPVARPVKEASVGWLDAWLRPIVAYALPSCSWKNGRGSGDC